MANLDWLVVRDLLDDRDRHLLEGRPGDRDRRDAHRGHRHRGVLPARPPRTSRRTAASPTPSGCCSGTTRRSSRRATRRSELWFFYHLGRRIREQLAGSTDETDRPVLDLTWDYPTEGPLDEPTPRRCWPRSTAADADGRAAVRRTPQLKDDGSTAVRLLDLLRRLRRRRQPGGPAQARPRADLGGPGVGLGLAGEPADPLQPRLGRPGRQAVERAQGATSGGTRTAAAVDRARRPRLRGRPGRRLPAARGRHRRRTALARRRPVHHAGRRQGLAVRARPGWSTARCPTHYEPQESPFRNPLYRPAAQPGPAGGPRTGQPVAPERRTSPGRGVPVRVHHLPADRAPHRRRDEPVAALPGRAAAGDVLRGLARAGRRARAGARRLGHDRHRPRPRSRPGCWSPTGCAPLRVEGRVVHQVGLPYHWGAERAGHAATRPTTCSASSLDPNVHIQEVKVADLRHPARAGGRAGRSAAALVEDVPAAGRHRPSDGRAMTTRGPTSQLDPADRWRPGRATPATPDAPAADGLLHRHLVCIGCKACEVACKEWNAVPDGRADLHRHRPTTTPARSAPTPGGTWRSSSSQAVAASAEPVRGRQLGMPPSLGEPVRRDADRRRRGAGDGAGLPLADVLRRLQALHPRRLPGRLPDRRAVPHRVRHRGGAGRRLQRLRLLRAGLPVRRDRPARGRTARRRGSARCATTGSATARSRPAPRPARPSRSSSAPLDELRERADAAGGDAARAGRAGRPALRRRPGRTASAATARSSCCSTSPRSTACRRTRW